MRLVLKLDGQIVKEYVFNKKDVTIGRTSANDIFIDNETVSGRHATLHTAETGSTILSDLNSRNGVFVNDKRVTRHKLNNGDTITLGGHELVYFSENTHAADKPHEQSEATVIMSADFQQQLQEELNKKKTATLVTRSNENTLWAKIKRLLGF